MLWNLGEWAQDISGSETRDLVHEGAASTPKSATDVEIAPLVEKVGAIPLAEIEWRCAAGGI